MKGFISIRFQKIIMFIPFLNCCILFLWLYNYSKTEKNHKTFFKSFITAISYALPFVIVGVVLSKLMGDVVLKHNLLNLIMFYLVRVALGFGLIRSQGKWKEGK